MRTCPSDNTEGVDQSTFLDGHTLHWDAHRIGWAVAGGCTFVTIIISITSILLHCRNYTNPRHQRQIIRILYLPPVYGVISFLSYRFFRDYTYYSLVQVVYEAITLSAFLLLLIEYVVDEQKISQNRVLEKEKRRLLFPVSWSLLLGCGLRLYTNFTASFAVFGIGQPSSISCLPSSGLFYNMPSSGRAIVTIVGIICQSKKVLCESQGFSPHYASVYLSSIDFASISVALYGLFLFYGLTKTELEDKRPVAKFLSIKLVIMFAFYQSFVFRALEGRVIHATQFWTTTNIANGLNALAICIEMIFFSALMMWAFPSADYRRPAGETPTKVWRPLWDSINYYDLAKEIYGFGFYLLNREQYNMNHEKRKEGPVNVAQDNTDLKETDPQSSNRVMGGSKDEPFDTWTRWQAKEMDSVQPGEAPEASTQERFV